MIEIKINSDGDTFWLEDGFLHRDDGPAVEYAHGTKEWWRNGKRHREYGPAIEYVDRYNDPINIIVHYPYGMNHWHYKGILAENVKSQKEFEQWLKYKSFL